MNRMKARELVRTVFATHKETMRVTDPSALEVLNAAETDMHALVEEIYQDCESITGDEQTDHDVKMHEVT